MAEGSGGRRGRSGRSGGSRSGTTSGSDGRRKSAEPKKSERGGKKSASGSRSSNYRRKSSSSRKTGGLVGVPTRKKVTVRHLPHCICRASQVLEQLEEERAKALDLPPYELLFVIPGRPAEESSKGYTSTAVFALKDEYTAVLFSKALDGFVFEARPLHKATDEPEAGSDNEDVASPRDNDAALKETNTPGKPDGEPLEKTNPEGDQPEVEPEIGVAFVGSVDKSGSLLTGSILPDKENYESLSDLAVNRRVPAPMPKSSASQSGTLSSHPEFLGFVSMLKNGALPPKVYEKSSELEPKPSALLQFMLERGEKVKKRSAKKPAKGKEPKQQAKPANKQAKPKKKRSSKKRNPKKPKATGEGHVSKPPTPAGGQDGKSSPTAAKSGAAKSRRGRSKGSANGKPAAKPTTEPTAKPTAAKPTAKPVTKPAAKSATKPAAKSANKPAAKPATKPAAKPAAKTATKPSTSKA